ncbi:MAG: hypothetical protein WA160_04475 [Pseudobdellovibrio sp.]
MQNKSKKTDIDILGDLPVKVDYLLLEDCFSNFKTPKKKIFDLKKKNYLHQIKRGLYFNLKSKQIESTPYEIIANSIYYPSYISMEWALQYYGLIMDRVTTVTSVTLKRSKDFKTPYAPFSFKHVPKNRYPISYVTKTNNAGDSFLIACPEKALVDYVNIKAKNLKINTADDIEEFLENDLRLDLKEFLKVTTTNGLIEILPFYHRNSKEHRILKWLIHLKESKR